MPQYGRDLTGVTAYFAAIAMLLGGIAWGVATAADALASSPAAQALSALLEADNDAERSKISHMIESSREIRAALAKPVLRRPLPPITASVERGHLRPGAGRHASRPKSKIPREALDAMAQGMWTASPRRTDPQFDLHKVY
jgi:hypothetical protein